MSGPLVSVVVPMHNAAPWIESTIQSVLGQSWPNVEVVVVDDASTDDSAAILRRIGSSRIHLLSQEASGHAAARNLALRHAQGDFIQFLDADDLLAPNKLESQLRLLIGAGQRLAVCPARQFFDGEPPERGIPDHPKALLETDDVLEYLVNLWGGRDGIYTFVPCHAFLQPRELADATGGWDERLIVDADGDYFTRAIGKAQGVLVARDTEVYYRRFRNPRSVSARSGAAACRSKLRAIESKAGVLLQRRDDPAARAAAGVLYMNLALHAYPSHAEICAYCLLRLRELDVRPDSPILGGPAINGIARYAGWKVGRRLQLVRHRLAAKLGKKV